MYLKSSDCNGAKSWKGSYEKNNFYHPVTLEWFSIQILANFVKHFL